MWHFTFVIKITIKKEIFILPLLGHQVLFYWQTDITACIPTRWGVDVEVSKTPEKTKQNLIHVGSILIF